jgi:hypothetical protein
VPGATSSLTPGNSGTAGEAAAFGLVDAPADDAAALGAGVVEARVVDPGVELAGPCPTAQAVARNIATMTRTAIDDADRLNGCLISFLLVSKSVLCNR